MNWEQKMQACQAIGEMSLKMRRPGDWYVGHEIDGVTDGYIVSGGCVTGAKTPEEAVDKHWQWLTNIGYDKSVLVRRGKDRKTVRWNGFMWEDCV